MSIFVCERCGADLSDCVEWLYLTGWGESLCILCYYVLEEPPQWTISVEERIAERINRSQPKQETLNV